MSNYLVHHGIHGQKWGERRFQNEDGSLTPAGRDRYLTSDGKMKFNKDDSKITKGVKRDYNTASDDDFRKKYGTSKKDYAKRVEKSKTGDLYAENKMVQKGLKAVDKKVNKEQAKIDKIQKDIDSFKPIKNGLTDSKGRVLLSKEDVDRSVSSLMAKQNVHKEKINSLISQVGETTSVKYDKETGRYKVSLKR